MRKPLVTALTVTLLSGCFSTEIVLDGANTQSPTILFYTGSEQLDDLLIVDGKNHFGKAQYQIDDPIGDIGFRFKDGQRFQAECIKQGKDIIGEVDCKRYEVYRSTFDLIPVGTQADKPSLY